MTEVNEFNRGVIEDFRSNHGHPGGPFEGAPVCCCTRPEREAATNGCTH
jgi:hypothetical protein